MRYISGVPKFQDSMDTIILYRLAGIINMYEKEDIDKAVKNYILFCLRHDEKSMRDAAARIINTNYPQYMELLNKYMILL